MRQEDLFMEVNYVYCCSFDIHKTFIVAYNFI